MAAIKVAWRELLAHPEVSEALTLRGRFGLMAFHGGLEAGTAEIAAAAAEIAGASAYVVRQPESLRWHVASTLVDPAASDALARFLGHVDAIIAVHGYGRPDRPGDVLVGGANRGLAAGVADALRAHLTGAGITVIDDLDAIPARLRGVHPANPVNMVPGGGVQVELPTLLRRTARAEVAGALAEVARAPG